MAGQNIVAPDTRERVLVAVRELGYQPNVLAQGLRLGQGRVVAMAVSDVEQGISSALTKQVQRSLEEIGLDLLLFDLGHREDRLQHLLERAQQLRLSGLVIALSDFIPMRTFKPLLKTLVNHGIAVVSVGQRLDQHGIPSVVYNETDAAAQAVRHFLQKGRTRIAFLGRIQKSAASRVRYRGYEAQLRRAGIAVDPDLVWDSSHSLRYSAGYEAMSRALQTGSQPRALVASSDELALGAMAAALDRGVRVPEEVAIIGFGGIDWGAYVRPSLTTLAADPAGISERVRDVFVQLRERTEVCLRQTLDRPLILRQST
jgi:DNA-binding LacI/PurR family transcriptional regulator